MQTRPVRLLPFILFLILSGTGHPGMAQFDLKDFTHYTVRDGLSDNNVDCFQQDEWGYLWIGTDAGLNRFDGNSFKSFFQSTAPLNLHSGNITRLKRFGDHQLGILSKGGIQLLNTVTYTVKNFTIPDTTAFSTQLNVAWDMAELPDSSYAVTTAAGFCVFNAQGEITLRHDAYHLEDIGRKRILYGRDIYTLSDNICLVYVEENKLAKYDHQTQVFEELNASRWEWPIFADPDPKSDGRWVVKRQLNAHEYVFISGQQDKIIYYNYPLGQRVETVLPAALHNSLSWQSKIEVMHDSLLLLNDKTNGFYVLRLNRQNGRIQCDGKKYLPEYEILSLFVDKDQRLWVGTNQGVLKQELRAPLMTTYKYAPKQGEKYSGGFTCVYRYKDKIYAGRFSRRNGLVILRADNMQLLREVNFFNDNNTPWNEIRSIEMYHPDTLWIGTNTSILWYDTKTGNYGKALDEHKYPWAEDFSAVMAPVRPDGYAWICSLLDGKVVRYHVPSRTITLFTSQSTPALPFDKVKSIAYDSYGDVWIGGHSLTRWNNAKQTFDTLITVYGGANKFNDDIITMSADDEGSLWLHNADNGLLQYLIKEKRFVAYAMKDGLPSDVLQTLSPVRHHHLWMAGNNQLALFNTLDKKFTVYDNADGFPDQKPTGRRMFFDTSSGLLYLGCNEYIVTFPFTPRENVDNSSDLILQEVMVDNRRTYYQPKDKLDIAYNENNVRLDYTIIDFEKSNYQFAYRLHPTEEWNVLGKQRSISLSNLSPGAYAIQFRVSGKPGSEKINTLFLTIRAPYWKTVWFISLVAVIFSGGLFVIIRNRIRAIRQRANLDRLLLQTEMKALQAQMSPHFIFNSLNSIGEMILNGENKDASNYLSKFARLIRITLDQSSHAMVSLRNTVDYLERYIEMEKIRNSLFTHSIVVDERLDVDETLLPPMLLQPFIENAIWHGVSTQRKDIHVQIEFTKAEEHLLCKIEDNGIGIFQAQKNRTEHGGRHQPVGITNIQNRVRLLNEKYHLQGDIRILDKKDISDGKETGTLVILQLPLELEAT